MLEAVEQTEREMASYVDADPVYLSTMDLIHSVKTVAQIQTWAALLLARLVHEAQGRGIPRRLGATGATEWLRDTTLMSNPAAARTVRLGKALDTHATLRRAALLGRTTDEQTATIAAVIDTLTTVEITPTVDDPSTRIAPEVLAKAADKLIDLAAELEPHTLQAAGERIVAHVAPEVQDRADEAALKRLDASAHALRRLHLSPRDGGRVRISGWLDTEAAAHVSAALDPLSKPLPSDDGPDPRTAGQRRADALVEVCQHAATAPSDSLAERPTVVVTVAYDTLKRQLGIGSFDLGGHLHPETVRRLACDAHIIPAVLDGAGQPLDVGRSKRLVTGALRHAVILGDGGCAFPGCSRPARWTQAHHIVHWQDGGPTSLANSVLLCGYHHRLIHRRTWHVRIAADGLPEFVPPAYIDPQRQPRRNIYHRRP
ncbi:HNH endonuclease [Virgisporangium aliadipatigenens]|uniref:HNH endonuclease n=1 Tax=Virgisporangium aliadipatigenens TaxID=741659 RepID=A0A8J4DP55_9ACTN|nr:HNH endonuclease signature motif containing protein [Virgisporangium aliadipatigenens]GIJ44278.1 HNH endonuclease [Virgisporangium aliadipatigenens]